MNQEEANQKILKLMNKEDDLSEEEITLFKELIFQCDLKQQNNMGYTTLLYALLYNDKQDLNLSEEQIDYLIKNSDLTQQNESGYTVLMYALVNNKSHNLNLSEEQIDYLIKNSDLKQKNKNGWTSLMYALINNKDQYLNLNKDQFEYLIKNSDLKQKNDNGWTALLYVLYYNKEQDLKLTTKQFKEMYNALNEKQKQTIFKNIIQVNKNNNDKYLEEINILLYNCEFKSNEETMNWLKENNYQDIIQIIEKRDVLFQLNQESQSIKNHKKITIIKI